MQVMVNATIGGLSIWSEPNGLAARAYGIAVCLTLPDWARYTPVRFVKE